MENQDIVSTLALGGEENVSTKKYYPEADSHTIKEPEFTWPMRVTRNSKVKLLRWFSVGCIPRSLAEAGTYMFRENTAQKWVQNIPRDKGSSNANSNMYPNNDKIHVEIRQHE